MTYGPKFNTFNIKKVFITNAMKLLAKHSSQNVVIIGNDIIQLVKSKVLVQVNSFHINLMLNPYNVCLWWTGRHGIHMESKSTNTLFTYSAE